MVGRGPLVVAAVGQHLDRELAGQQPERPAQQRLVAEEHAEPGQGLEVLDQVVSADVGFQVAAQEPGVRGDPAAEAGLEISARHQVAVQAAPGPGAQRGRVREPRVAGPERAGRLPGSPQPGEHVPRRRAVRLGRQAPRPVPVVQVETPQPRRAGLPPVGLLPAGQVAERPGDAEEPDLAGPQLREARPVRRRRGGQRRGVERAEAGRPAGRRRARPAAPPARPRPGQQPLARPRPPVQRGALGAQPGPVRDLGRAQVRGGAAEQRQLPAGHGAAGHGRTVPSAGSPRARASARMPSAKERGAYPRARTVASMAKALSSARRRTCSTRIRGFRLTSS